MNRDEQSRGVLQAMLPKERRAVGVIALIAMIRMFGLFALLPVLSIFAADLTGATPFLVGLSVGAYGLTQASLQIPFGLLSGAGAISATLTALLTDATREEVRTRSMAVFGIGIGISFVLALILGPIIAGQSGVRSLFWFAAALAGVAAVLLTALPAGIQRPQAVSQVPISSALRPSLLRLDFYVFILHALLTASFVALPFLLRNRLEIALTDHWKLYIGALIVSLVGTIPLIFTDERKGKQGTVGLAVGLLFAGLLILAFGGVSVLPVFVALAIFFAGFNFLEAGLPARLSILAPGELRGTSLGVFASSQFLGAFAGGLIGGYFLAGGQPSRVFVACASLAFIWLLLHQFSGAARGRVENA
jgi:predicted MFS family arabinose efflux permease